MNLKSDESHDPVKKSHDLISLEIVNQIVIHIFLSCNINRGFGNVFMVGLQFVFYALILKTNRKKGKRSVTLVLCTSWTSRAKSQLKLGGHLL
jgi:hypothetical protein